MISESEVILNLVTEDENINAGKRLGAIQELARKPFGDHAHRLRQQPSRRAFNSCFEFRITNGPTG